MNAKNHPWEDIYARDGRVFTEPFPAFSSVSQKFTQNQCRRILDLGCGNGRHVIAFVTVAGQKHQDLPYEEIESGTYVPLEGTEKGLPHHIFTEEELCREFKHFQIQDISSRDKGRVLAIWIKKIV